MIELDPSQKAPLYEQLYAALADEIRTGQRAAGTPLPGRRTMAAQQGVSVNTVDTAYQMLAAEGLAEARPRSGFYVQSTYGMLHSRARRTPAAPVPPPAAPAGPVPLYDLSTGSVDTALFPAHSWGRIQKELLYQRPELLQRGEMQGDAPLRAQIAEYLSVYRGVDCTPEQIVVGAGIEYLLGCLAHLFHDGMAAIENPGYSRTRTVLQNSGIPCTLVDIDREGLPAAALEKSGAASNTIVVLTSDNGPWINYGDHAGSTGGLREGKGTTFEGGQRVPCIVWWPGTTPAGTICNQLASSIDLLPTFAEIAGTPLPAKQIDGVSIRSLFEGVPDATPRTSFLFYYRKNSLEAVRDGRYKLVFAHPGRSYEAFPPGNGGRPGKVAEGHEFPLALYDMRRDPGERYDVQSQHPEVVEELMRIADAAREDLGDDLRGMPGRNRRPAGRAE